MIGQTDWTELIGQTIVAVSSAAVANELNCCCNLISVTVATTAAATGYSYCGGKLPGIYGVNPEKQHQVVGYI